MIIGTDNKSGLVELKNHVEVSSGMFPKPVNHLNNTAL
jgi:hypothetical protein